MNYWRSVHTNRKVEVQKWEERDMANGRRSNEGGVANDDDTRMKETR